GDIRGQAFDADRVDRLKDIGVTLLDRRGLAHDMDGDLDLDLLLQVDLVEVDVDRPQPARVCLNLADENFFRPGAIQNEVDKLGPAGLDEDPLELEPIERERGRLGVMPVDDRWQLALAEHSSRALAQGLAG